MAPKTTPNGIIRCARYSFMPNRLHLCGPENQADILEFYAKSNQQKESRTIQPLLESFETMYPYLKLIARANQQRNPFAEEIVEAYWLGNEKLKNVPVARLFNHVIDNLALKKKGGQKEYGMFEKKFNTHAVPHHNFHVFSIWCRTGNTKTPHTLVTMDACRISWGKVVKKKPYSLIVETKPLIADKNGKIKEADFNIEREILNYFENNVLLRDIEIGDYVSLHWGCVCEKLTREQVKKLQYYTELSLMFAGNL